MVDVYIEFIDSDRLRISVSHISTFKSNSSLGKFLALNDILLELTS